MSDISNGHTPIWRTAYFKMPIGKRNKRVIANANVISEIDTALTSPLYSATAYLAHLLLRETQPNPHAKAKEPNVLAPFL